MSSYLYGLFWNTNMTHFDFIYTNKNDDTKYSANTQNIETIDKLKINSITLNNLQINTLNLHICELPFSTLIINCCKINSIENLNLNKHITKMIIIDSDILDMQKLTENNITNLTIINTKNININDRTNRGILQKSRSIDFGLNKIDNIDFLKNYDKLKYLYINNNLIKHISPIEYNINMKYLNISYNQIENINIIMNFNNLEILNIINNPILILPDLLKFKNLDFDNLKVNWNNIKDVCGMKGFGLMKNIIKSLINKNY